MTTLEILKTGRQNLLDNGRVTGHMQHKDGRQCAVGALGAPQNTFAKHLWHPALKGALARLAAEAGNIPHIRQATYKSIHSMVAFAFGRDAATIILWNDWPYTTDADVLAAFDRAILAEEWSEAQRASQEEEEACGLQLSTA